MAEELHMGAPTKNFYYSRGNRQVSTKAEEILWNALRNRKLKGFKFRRQHPISYYIADFYCHECKLVVELDGEYHDSIEQKQYDEGRTYELRDLEIKVVRFMNSEVIENLGFVLDGIFDHLFQYCCKNYTTIPSRDDLG